ncbi:MAG TPA: class I SAM-dependent methyltransferase [Acidimicrobiales bacterium]|nr:class I SAM-dependent methyltransferase [Acidimicrobiales bacterium]
MADTPPDWVEVNRRNWDERVPIHLASSFYDVDGFRAGRGSLEPFEVEEMGALGGLRLVHLQCHFGLDTLDLVRLHPTLSAVGLDFSPPAVASATDLAAELGLASRVSFVEADVRHAASVLGAGSFDVVYTGKGALCWLPDLDAWAAQCASLLKPGGWLYVSEFHPVGDTLAQDAPLVTGDYFRTEPWVDEEPGTYAERGASMANRVTYTWNHPLPELFSALIGAGFRLRFFHEYDYTRFPMNPWLVRSADGRRWTWPPTSGRLPLMFSLRAVLD